MTYQPNNNSYDAFGRVRTSDTGQRLDVEFLYDKSEEYIDEDVNGVSATVTHNTNSRDLTLTAGSTTNGEYAKMSSYPVPYTPGNSQLIDITSVLDLANIGSGTAQTFIRTNVTGSVVETAVDQSSWDNNTSGVDWADSHIFMLDFQSLKVGSIRYYMVQNGVLVKINQVDNDNIRNTGYWQLANLPAYWKIYNDATYSYMECGYGDEDNAIGFRYRITKNASATMKAICCTVKSEGGFSLRDIGGIPRTVDNGVTVVTVSTTLIPLISIRPKSTFNSLANLIISLPRSFFIQADESIRYAILHDCGLTGASWSDVDAGESCMEYDISATAVTNGHEVYSGYLYGSSSGAKGTIDAGAGSDVGVLGKNVLWYRSGSGSGSGILTVAAVRSDITDADCLAGFRWEEIR